MKAILAAAALTAATALPSFAFDPANMNDAEKQAFGQAVRDYLISNPEVLMEAMNEYEVKQQAESAKNDRALVQSFSDDIFEDGYSWVGGNPDGNITMVEFMDYKCGYCKQVNPQVEDFLKTDANTRYIIKEFPILGPESELAARFAIAVKQAAGDEAYKKAHDALMALRAPVNEESLKKIAGDIGVDAPDVLKRLNDDAVTEVIQKNHALAQKMQIQGTPTFIIGGEMLRGVPQQGIAAVVETVRKSDDG